MFSWLLMLVLSLAIAVPFFYYSTKLMLSWYLSSHLNGSVHYTDLNSDIADFEGAGAAILYLLMAFMPFLAISMWASYKLFTRASKGLSFITVSTATYRIVANCRVS